MYDRILVPVDGSDCARRAAEYGLGLARAYDAAVDLLYVVDADAFVPALVGEEERQRHRERGREALADVADLAAGTDLDVETHLRDGGPSEEIVDVASEETVDLVVMGKHGRKGLSRYLLGSTTTAVLRHADVPVLVVPDGEPTGSLRGEFDDVLYPTDGSECAGRAADHVQSVATRFDAPVHVLTVVDVQRAAGPFDAGGVDQEWIDRRIEEGQQYVDDAVDRLRTDSSNLGVEGTVREGPPHEVIADYADEEDLDMVVMGSHGRSGLEETVLGSVTERLVGAGVAPVLVVR